MFALAVLALVGLVSAVIVGGLVYVVLTRSCDGEGF